MMNYWMKLSCMGMVVGCLYFLSGTLTGMDIFCNEENICSLSLDTLHALSGCGPPDTEWIVKIGGPSSDYGHSVKQTPDGGYIILGFTYSYGPLGNMWLIKTDSHGQVMWTKSYGGVQEDIGYDVQLTLDGGYILVGHTISQGKGDKDIWLLKTNSEGTVLWQRTYGGIAADWSHSVYPSSDGGYIIAGFQGNKQAGDAWIIKTDNEGLVEWEKTIGGAARDASESIQQTTDGGYIITGYTASQGAGNEDVWLIKIHPDGAIEWQKTYGDLSDNRGYSVQETTDGGYIIAGSTGGAPSMDVLLIKTNCKGEIQFQKTYGDKLADDHGLSVRQTFDGGYIIVGYGYFPVIPYDEFIVLKTDSQGSLIWNTTFGGVESDWGRSVQQTMDGGYIITGSTWSADQSSCNIWLIKLASSSLPPQIPLMPQGPSSGVTNVSYSYFTHTVDPQGLQIDYCFDWGDDTSNWTGLSPSDTLQEASHIWGTPGTYYIRVKARNQEGAQSHYSPTFPLVISANSPPNVPPRPIGFESGKIRMPYSYSTVTTDPDNDKIYYLFDWGDSTDTGWIGPFMSGESITVSHTWSTPGTYHIRVKARDDHTLESQWSESLIVALPCLHSHWIELLQDLIHLVLSHLENIILH